MANTLTRAECDELNLVAKHRMIEERRDEVEAVAKAMRLAKKWGATW